MPRFRSLIPILLSLLVVLGGWYFLRADVPAQVYFSADTIVSLTGLADGDLWVAQDSECDSLSAADGVLEVVIPDGKSFTLKTAGHARALSLTASGGTVELSFSGADLAAGNISRWTISSPSGSGSAGVVWGMPSFGQQYAVRADGAAFGTYLSDGAKEIAFSTGLLSGAKVFSIEIGSASAGTSLLGGKLDASGTVILRYADGLEAENVPRRAVQVAVSTFADFKGASWEDIGRLDTLLAAGADAPELFVKFRAKSGSTSDVVRYDRSGSGLAVRLNEGDIVKTPDNPDVYILKYKNGKQYRRLILSPSVFASYGHLRWENIKVISPTQLERYSISALVQVAGDSTLYELTPLGDTGRRRAVPASESRDTDSVYEINAVDRDSYLFIPVL